MRLLRLRRVLLPVFAVTSALLWGVVEFIALQRAALLRSGGARRAG